MLLNVESNNIPSEITIGIVTYEKDFDLLDRLLLSIINNWDLQQIEILIVLNDIKEKEEELKKIVEKYNEIKTRIIYASDIINFEKYDWYSQQVLKLFIPKYIRTPWYLLLDSKNYFKSLNKKIKISDFFNQNGKAYGTWGTTDDVFFFKNSYKLAYKLWNLDPPTAGQALNEFTPLFFYTKLMEELIEELEYKFQSLLPYLFIASTSDGFFLTEFSVMSAYIKYKNMNEVLYDPIKFTDPVMKALGNYIISDKDLRRH